MIEDNREGAFDSRSIAIRTAWMLGGMTAAAGLLALVVIRMFP